MRAWWIMNCMNEAKHGAAIVSMWPRGVTVGTLDSESSDRGSNPREASWSPTRHATQCSTARSGTRKEEGQGDADAQERKRGQAPNPCASYSLQGLLRRASANMASWCNG